MKEWEIRSDSEGFSALYFVDPSLEPIHVGSKVNDALNKVRDCIANNGDIGLSERAFATYGADLVLDKGQV
jgi:hypothetical protein